jgi:hypothetical protein
MFLSEPVRTAYVQHNAPRRDRASQNAKEQQSSKRETCDCFERKDLSPNLRILLPS